MDYIEVLQRCPTAQVGEAIVAALGALFQQHLDLLRIDANEPAIAAQLARLLAPHFTRHEVDVEYNRMGKAPKAVKWADKPERVFPDIVVHRRGANDDNLLVVEVKKSLNPESKDHDIRKLEAYRRELNYQSALFIRFGVGDLAGTVIECEWV